MRRIASQSFAVSSLLGATLAIAMFVMALFPMTTTANAATRPRYGGTLRVAMQTAPTSLDPTGPGSSEWFGSRNLSHLMFDTLITLDNNGKPQPSLATSWQSEPSHQRWQFSIRRGITFQDGTALTSDAVAASLRAVNPTWKVLSSGEAVIVERDSAAPNLPAELALPRNSVLRRESGKISGTGPFTVTQWDPGKKLVLAARDDYWAGRPFIDSIEIEMGKNFHDQMIALDLGRADVIEVAPDQLHRTNGENNRVEHSDPIELMALVFTRDRQSTDDGPIREALALSIDRESLNKVVLQSGGEPSAALLPEWISGYAFVFPAGVDLARARQNLAGLKQSAPVTLGYDSADPGARVVVERIVLNAHDAGLSLQPTSGAADLRLVRIPLVSLNAHVALTELTKSLGLPPPKFNGNSNSEDDLYAAENTLLQSQRVIPLLHLRTASALQASVKNWHEARDGNWSLPDVWLGTPGADKP
jgi:ABC-type transport system substrate-binding protein